MLPRSFALLCLPLFAACSTVNEAWSELTNTFNVYQEPEEGPRVKLRLTMNANGYFRIYPQASCIDHAQPKSGMAFLSNVGIYVPVPRLDPLREPRDLGVAGLPVAVNMKSRDIWLPTGQPSVVWYVTGTSEGQYHYSCGVKLLVNPSSTSDHQIVADMVGSGSKLACFALLYELGADGPKPIPAVKAPMCSEAAAAAAESPKAASKP